MAGKERPILFSGEMIRAILDGRKTQTRRVIKPQPKPWSSPVPGCQDIGGLEWKGVAYQCDSRDDIEHHSPYGKPGDRLWVKETWIPVHHGSYEAFEKRQKPRSEYDAVIQYAADPHHGYHQCFDTYEGKWRPSIFMPRWASRITLEVVKVRVERVQDISGDDILQEGVDASCVYCHHSGLRNCDGSDSCSGDYSYVFRGLWDTINEKRGFGWDVNPWVWVIDFRRLDEHSSYTGTSEANR